MKLLDIHVPQIGGRRLERQLPPFDEPDAIGDLGGIEDISR